VTASGKIGYYKWEEIWEPKCYIFKDGLIERSEMSLITPKDQSPSFSLSIHKNDRFLVACCGTGVSLFQLDDLSEKLACYKDKPVKSVTFDPCHDNGVFVLLRDGTLCEYDVSQQKQLSSYSFKQTDFIKASTDTLFLVGSTSVIIKKLTKSKTYEIACRRSLLNCSPSSHILLWTRTSLDIYKEPYKQKLFSTQTFKRTCYLVNADISCDGKYVFGLIMEPVKKEKIVFVSRTEELQEKFKVPYTRYNGDGEIIKAHPRKENVFAVGCTTGEIVIMEVEVHAIFNKSNLYKS